MTDRKEYQKIYFQKRRAIIKANPSLAEKEKEKTRLRQKAFRDRIKKDPERYKKYRKRMNESHKKTLAKMPKNKKKEMIERGRKKYENSKKGKALRLHYKLSGKKKKDSKLYYEKIKYDPNFIEKRKISTKKRLKENKDKVNKTTNTNILKRRKTDPLFKLAMNMRGRMRLFIKKSGFNKNKSTFKLIGCTPDELKLYLEKKFKEGMTWKNHGNWHIDHIKPLASAKSVDEINILFHYTNLQPLWAEENIKKKDKY